MTFGPQPQDTSSPPNVMSSVVPDGSTTPVALAGGPSYSDSGNTKAPAQVYVPDGKDVTQGVTTDAAVVGDNSGTVSAKLRGLTKIFNDIWDSVNHLFAINVKQYGGVAPQMFTAEGTAVAGVPEIGMGIYAGSGTVNRVSTASGTGDAQFAANSLPVISYLRNTAGTWDYQRANLDNITLISASNVSTLQTSADQTNFNAKGVIIILNVTVIGTGNLITTIQAKGPVSGVYKTLLVSLAVSSATSAIYIVYPGLTELANLKSGNPLPRTWNVTVSGANGSTFTVEAMPIN